MIGKERELHLKFKNSKTTYIVEDEYYSFSITNVPCVIIEDITYYSSEILFLIEDLYNKYSKFYSEVDFQNNSIRKPKVFITKKSFIYK